jgi:hypothetical protein
LLDLNRCKWKIPDNRIAEAAGPADWISAGGWETFHEDAGDKTGLPRAAKWFLIPCLFIELHVSAIWESDIH